MKLGIIFSILLLFIVTLVLLITHNLFNNFFVNYVTEELKHRGHGHAEVLAEHYGEVTLEHVIHMEKDAITDVIIVDNQRKVVTASKNINIAQKDYVEILEISKYIHQEAIETDWRNQPHIITRSPIIRNNEVLGAVYMFTPTQPIRDAVAFQFKILLAVWVISGIVGVSFIFLLSKIITKPLREMKVATEKISGGSFDIEIVTQGNDELADLGNAINTLAKNLNHYETSRHEFLSDISHELRTPLTYLKGYSELLVKGEVKDEGEVQQFLQIIYDESRRVQRLVQDILTLSKMDEPSFSIVKTEHNLVHFIENTMGKVQPLYTDKNVKLSLSFEKKDWELSIDGERMAQVIVNLLDNALRYTPPNGEVKIILSRTTTLAKIVVQDSGCGISEEDLPHIWQRLYRTEKSRSRDTGGSGLGLTIVKKIVDLHEGELYVSSELGKGTTFEIYLPIS